jgi:hypothetical protein
VAGTQTCVRVSGHVRVEKEVGRPLRFEKAAPFATPLAGGLTAVSSPDTGPIPRGFGDESSTTSGLSSGR